MVVKILLGGYYGVLGRFLVGGCQSVAMWLLAKWLSVHC